MIELTEQTRMRLMTIHGCIMLALGLALFYIRAMMTNLFFYVLGGALALLLVAGSLLLIAGVDWLCVVGLGWRQTKRLRSLLLVSTAVALCCLLLIFYPRGTIRLLCYVLATYSLLLGAAKLGFARSWNGSPGEHLVMYLMAGLALAFGGALLLVAPADNRDALAVIAAFSLFMGAQMLLTMYFLQRQVLKMIDRISAFSRTSA
jgi:uncharacterized membrane protein HdeD (DUF308 family)